MNETAYTVEEVSQMAHEFDLRLPAFEEHSGLVALASELSNYLRAASGRVKASESKVAIGIAVLDIWSEGSASILEPQLSQDRRLVHAASLITVGAATAILQPDGEEANDAISIARLRIEQAISELEPWREVWSAANRLGAQTGFCLELEASRAVRIWQAMFRFAADHSPLLLPVIPVTVLPALQTVISRSRATDSAMLTTIKASWPPLQSDIPSEGSYAPLPPARELDPHESILRADDKGEFVSVWFGTNRVPDRASDPTSGYSSTLDPGNLHYGRCNVKVPPTEEALGGIGRFISAWLRPGRSRSSRFGVESYYRFANELAFQQELDSELKHMASDSRSVLVFIHGYNTSFQAGAEAAARLSVGIKHPGATAMFSWASRGKLLKYGDDERTVDLSRHDLAAFLQTLSSVVDFDHIDVVVHSLGNRLFLRTLVDYFQNGPPPVWRLRNLFLGAPDIDQSEYLRDASIYLQAAASATMYGSTSDTALLASQVQHRGIPRAGLMPPVAWTGAVHAIETSAANNSRLGHNVLLDVPSIHADAKQIVDGQFNPDLRANLRRSGSSTNPYWRF